MRSKLRLIGLGLLVMLMTGCESTRWNWLKREPGPELPTKPGAGPTVIGLVQYLNDNANRVRSVKVDELSVDASIENQTIGLRGRVFAEKPRSFRMKSTLFGKDEVDIGSNPQEFWFWAAKNRDPYQYFCSYKDLDDGRVRTMPLPIQPEWVMETMGLGPYGPADKYQLEQDANSLRLVERTKSPMGHAVRKVIVMSRQPVKSPQPQVTSYLLIDDATGQEICSAHITATQIDRPTGAILPYKMELRVPSQKMKMALKMDSMTVNPQFPPTVFARQQMTGVEPFNLATNRTEPWNLQRVGN